MLKIEELIESKKFPNDIREYVGASVIGNPCPRAIWYTFRFATPRVEITAREKRLFSRGHQEENVVNAELLLAGCIQVSEQEKSSFVSGHGSGHNDGIWKNCPDFEGNFLLECKTAKDDKFKTLKRYSQNYTHNQAIAKFNDEYYAQVNVYMHEHGLVDCLYVVTNKNTDERLYLHLKYCGQTARKMLAKADYIIKTNTPPERIGDRDYYRCRPYICKITGDQKLFCEHREVCHNNARYQKSCRTCNKVKLHDKGRWFCSKKETFLSLKKQLKGCKKYECI